MDRFIGRLIRKLERRNACDDEGCVAATIDGGKERQGQERLKFFIKIESLQTG
jgi:hypothetical protein